VPQLASGLGDWPALALIGLSFGTSLITITFSLGRRFAVKLIQRAV
jgi:hypothetical protein